MTEQNTGHEIEKFTQPPAGLIKSAGSEVDVVGRLQRVSILEDVDGGLFGDLDEHENRLHGLLYQSEGKVKREFTHLVDYDSSSGGHHESGVYFTVTPEEELPPALTQLEKILNQSGRPETLHVHAMAYKNGGVWIFVAPDTLHHAFFTRNNRVANPATHYRKGRSAVFHGAEGLFGLPDNQVGLLFMIDGRYNAAGMTPKFIGALGYRSAPVSKQPRKDLEQIFSNPFTGKRLAIEVMQDTTALLTGEESTSESGISWKDMVDKQAERFANAQLEFKRQFGDGKKHFVEVAANSEILPPELAAVLSDFGIIDPEDPNRSAFVVFQMVNQTPTITIGPEALTRDNAQFQMSYGYKSGAYAWVVQAITSDPVPSRFQIPEIYTKDLLHNNLFYEQLFAQLVGVGAFANSPALTQASAPIGEIEAQSESFS